MENQFGICAPADYHRRMILRCFLLLLSCLSLAGCQGLAYYGQAAQGQFALMAKRQDISALLAAEHTDPVLRERLLRVQRIRAFAERELALPVRGQYDRYVALGRDYPVWSVMATPPLSLRAHRWCYPFVGCLAYRGYFREADAQKEAARRAAAGDDVYVSGIPAYSTLGWFSDPVLSSFVHWPEPELAELIFHELAHQKLFVPGDTVFNESFAVVVAEAGLARYEARYGLDLASWRTARARRADFVALVMAHRTQLQARFKAAATDDERRAARTEVYAALRAAHAAQKEAWGGYSGYDAWFAELNNARLNAVGSYYELVPALRQLLAQGGDDLPTFYRACRALARLSYRERQARLDALLATEP